MINPPKTPKEILQRARQVLVVHGWVKRAQQTDDGYCMLGAVDVAYMEAPAERADVLTDLALYALRAALPRGYGSVANYNDTPHTTKADVLKVIDDAIASFDKDEGSGA